MAHGKSLQSCPTLRDPMDCVARQAPWSMGFSRQEYWSGLPWPLPGNLPDPGIKPTSLHRQVSSLPLVPPGKPFPCSSLLKCFGSLSRSVKIEAPWVVKILHDSTEAFLSIFHLTVLSVDCAKWSQFSSAPSFQVSGLSFFFPLRGMTRELICILEVIPSIDVSLLSLDF